VPPIRAELRDANGQDRLFLGDLAAGRRAPAGQSATFNSAEVDVPAAARRLHLSFGPPSRPVMRIGILTGGGDVPGLNPCIRSITLSADDLGWEVVGFRRGWDGRARHRSGRSGSAIAANSLPLTREGVRGIDRMGGTILHTSRTDPRTLKAGDQTARVLDVLETARHRRDGHAGRRRHLALLRPSRSAGLPVISIPKTMDNDVFGTDYCIGFSTAVSRSVEAINALGPPSRATSGSAVVELFGRRSGETALLAGFLAQVDRTVIAEVPADLDILLPLLAEDKATNPARYAMCVISEGATIQGATRTRTSCPSPASERTDVGSRPAPRPGDHRAARLRRRHPGARLPDARRRAGRDGPDGRPRLRRPRRPAPRPRRETGRMVP
jgi:6-phosphofructokinase